MRPFVALVLAAGLLCAGSARAVILLGDADAEANKNAPTGELADSGWQYQGQWGSFLGTPIAPRFFVTAKHVGGGVGQPFLFRGVNYTTAREISDPRSDLRLWQISDGQEFPDYAPLYSRDDEFGHQLVVIGRGTERGAEIFRTPRVRGWGWGADTHVQRWGTNVVAGIYVDGPRAEYLYATFDETGGANKAHLSAGDSGGAVFMKEGATWKLAAINYAVDGPFYPDASGSGAFDAALFDARNFYYTYDGTHFFEITGAEPEPSGFYATRIASKRGWIYSVIDPLGDRDGDGVANLLEYAFYLDPDLPDAAELPRFAIVSGQATLTYRRAFDATDLQFTIERSDDLISWQPANAQEEVVDSDYGYELIEASVAGQAGQQLFLRLRVTRP